MADASVLTIAPGSVLVMRGVAFDTAEEFNAAVHALHKGVGHSQFAVLAIDEDDGTVEILESAEGLIDFLRAQGIEV